MSGHVIWPRCELVPRNPSYNCNARSFRGPPSKSGMAQVVTSAQAVWRITFGQLPITKVEDIRTLRAFASRLKGSAGTVLLPVHDPVPRSPAGVASAASVPHSDKAYFSDGAGYVSTLNDVLLGGAILEGATAATVIIGVAGDLGPGNHFSIGNRLHLVETLSDNGNGTHAMTFWPPAREAAALGARLEFDFPVVLARLADDSQLDLRLDLTRFGHVDIEFVEAR